MYYLHMLQASNGDYIKGHEISCTCDQEEVEDKKSRRDFWLERMEKDRTMKLREL